LVAMVTLYAPMMKFCTYLKVMRLSVGRLRNLVREAMSLSQQPDHWVVTAGMLTGAGEYMGFAVRREGGAHKGYTTKGTWAPFQALKNMDAARLSGAIRKPVPEGVTANDMLEVLKTEKSFVTKSGVKLVPEPGLQDNVAQVCARITASRFAGQGITLVVMPQSSSDFGYKFGKYLADLIKATAVPAGVVKNMNPEEVSLELPPGVGDTSAGKNAMRDLGRWKGHLQAGNVPSLRKTFDPRMRHYLRGFMKVDDQALSGGGKVLVVDDVVTTGSTQTDTTRALKVKGFTVVANVAAFKEQSA
jgi:hypothetical protein